MLKSKKYGLVLLMSLLSSAVLAQANSDGSLSRDTSRGIGARQGQPGENFGELKQRILNRIDGRLEKLHNAKECVASAQNPQQLKQCRPAHRDNGEGDA
jgi:hypothetical protein